MKSKGWERWAAILTLMPSVILIAVFVYGFISWTVFVSFTKWDSGAPDYTFVGLANYQRLFSGTSIESQRFFIDLRNLIGFAMLFLATNIVAGFGLAILIDSRIRGENFFRSVYLLPYSISFIF